MGNASNCTNCADGGILVNGQCLTECPERTYFNGQMCQSCSSACFNCVDSANNCISCAPGLFLYNGQCVPTCPNIVADRICSANCPSGQYRTGQTCAPCQSPCVTCTGLTTCTSCQNGNFAYNGQCLPSCPANTLPVAGYCSDCAASCNGCTANPSTCVSCAAGYY